jgi:hypothetical protein
MRNLLAIVGAATITFLALGWYLGWYQVSSTPSPQGTQSVNVELNPTKITEDVKKGVERGGEFVDQFREKSKAPEAKQPPGPASNFFSPTPADGKPGSSGGWKPIGTAPPPADDPDRFGFRCPRN